MFENKNMDITNEDISKAKQTTEQVNKVTDQILNALNASPVTGREEKYKNGWSGWDAAGKGPSNSGPGGSGGNNGDNMSSFSLKKPGEKSPLPIQQKVNPQNVAVEYRKYNTINDAAIKDSAMAFGQTTDEVVAASVQDSDAARGKREMQDISKVTGVNQFIKSYSAMGSKDSLKRKITNDAKDIKHAKKITERAQSQGYHGKYNLKDAQQKARAMANLSSSAQVGLLTGDALNSFLGGQYRTGSSRTGDVLADYHNNINVLEKYLEANGINAKNLNVHEIEHALKTGRLGSAAHLGGTVDLSLFERDAKGKIIPIGVPDSVAKKRLELQSALLEYGKLKGQKDVVKKVENTDSFAKGIGKTAVTKALGDSDAAAGYKNAMVAYNVGKVSTKMIKGAAGLGINAALSSPELIAKLGNKMGGAVTGAKKKILTRKQHRELMKTGNISKATADKLAKVNTKNANFRAKVRAIDTGQGGWGTLKGAKSKVKYVSRTSVGGMLKDANAKLLEKTGIAAKRDSIKRFFKKKLDAFKKTKVGKALDVTGRVLKAPAKAINAVTRTTKKAVLIVGLAAGIIILLDMGYVVIMGSLAGPAVTVTDDDEEDERDPEDDIEDDFEGPDTLAALSVAQLSVDALYEKYHSHYMNMTSAREGSPYIKFGIPENWELKDMQDTEERDTIAKQEFQGVYEGGELSGYRLYYYWGPEVHPYKCKLKGKALDGFEETETGEQIPKFKETTNYLQIHGCANIGGYAGEYWDEFIKDGEGNFVDWILVDSGCEPVQTMRETANPKDNVKVEIKWQGATSTDISSPTLSKGTSFTDTGGNTFQYDEEILFRSILCAGIGFTYDTDEELPFFTKYCEEQLFDKAMNNATVSFTSHFIEDKTPHTVDIELDPDTPVAYEGGTDDLLWAKLINVQEEGKLDEFIEESNKPEIAENYLSWLQWLPNGDPNDPETMWSAYACRAKKVKKVTVELTININDAGLLDMFNIDETTNDWAHSNGDTGIYEEQDVTNPDYTAWTGWWSEEGSEAREIAQEYFELDEEEWAEEFKGVIFPGSFKVKQADIPGYNTASNERLGMGLITSIYENKEDFEIEYDGGTFGYPMKKYVAGSRFGPRTDPVYGGQGYHNGIDLSPRGSNDPPAEIYAPYAGVVCIARFDTYQCGKIVVLKHGNGIYTQYMHCESIYVQEGDYVDKGDLIAAVGTTGKSTGAHLHFGCGMNTGGGWQYMDPDGFYGLSFPAD